MLKQIYDAPKVLYTIGNIELLHSQNNIAIIGCRRNTKYGEKAAKYFAASLAKEGITIISGLARGIDGIAHKGALMAKGKTIAVLGHGLDKIYPPEHIELAREIIAKKGLIISEYPLGTNIKQKNFPERNRIISGLSRGVLVIEAKNKSGTITTVDFALDQGREVFAVPGSINFFNSEGTNELIKQGATLVMNYKDVLKNI